MTQQEIFQQKARHYLLCYVNECPLHERCLRWLVGQEGDPGPISKVSINPRHPDIKANRCTMFQENVKVRYAKGMMNFFYDMPHHTEVAIRSHLIALFSRKRFYEYRNGTRLIPPDVQSVISHVCKQAGWTAELQYDGWEEDYKW